VHHDGVRRLGEGGSSASVKASSRRF
jgi:hypothetical protein